MNDTETVVPHPPLTEYYADETARHRWLRATFDASAVDYDRVERLMAFGTGPWYRRQALRRAGLKSGMRVLDVGTGTGLTAIEAARLSGGGAHVTGVDPSAGMLANARLPAGMRVGVTSRGRSARDVQRVFSGVATGRSYLRARDHAAYRCPCNALAAFLSALSGPAGGTVGGALAQNAAGHALPMGLDRSVRAAAKSSRADARGRITKVSRHVVLGIFSEYVAVK